MDNNRDVKLKLISISSDRRERLIGAALKEFCKGFKGASTDAIVREAHGRQYPAKDAHMTGADFRAAYPAWQSLEQLRDPALMSRFWQRTTR